MFKSMRQNGFTKGTDREHKRSMEGGFRHTTSESWLDGNEQLMVGGKQKMYTMQDMKKVGLPWWFRLCTSKPGGTGLIPSQGNKIPRITQQKKKKKKKHFKEPSSVSKAVDSSAVTKIPHNSSRLVGTSD